MLSRMSRRSGTLLLASVLFFASGALGLGYQLVWVKKAALIVGGSQIALATVVTSFFLGLALGSLFVGRHLRSRRWSPLFVYGAFETAIGLFALAFPWLFDVLESAYSALFPFFADTAFGLFALRFMLLFLFFLAPTFLMGGTLPLLLDGLVARDRSVGSLTSFLYGLNIAGAVVGVLLAGYWAIPELGMNGTSSAAGVGNLCIGAAAFLAFWKTPPLHAAVESSVADAASFSRPARAFMVLSFLSGFAALGYQMAWARYFSLFSHSTVYLIAVLLAVYLSALSVGAMLLALVLRRGIQPLRVLAISQPLAPVIAFASLTAWTLAYYNHQPADRLAYTVLPRWSVASDAIDALFLAPTLQVALVLFVPVVLLGSGLPGLIAAATRSSASLRSISGSLVFWNTIGSSAGGFIAGYLLIPTLGLTGTFFALAVVSIALGVAAEALLMNSSTHCVATRRRWLRRPVFVGCAAALAFVAFSAREDIVRETIMVYGTGYHPTQETRLTALVEGPLTTAFVLDRDGQRLIGAGSVLLAGVPEGLPFQSVQGSIGPLFYPRPGAPKDVLGIALGSGQTFGGILLHPIEHLDVVDISTEIVELSLTHFAEYQHGLATDPRVTFHLDDGRHFIGRAADESYDLVTSEPPPPTDAGVHALYSYEFYEQAHRVLRDGGILQSWLPLYRVTPDDVRGMLETQAAVFPYTFLIKQAPEDINIVSFKLDEPPLFRREWFEERLARFRAEREVAGYHWPGPPTTHPLDSVEGLVALLMTGPEDIDALDFPLIHREDDLRLSYSSGDRELMRRYQDLEWLARLSFAAIPMTPVAELVRYFDWPLPVESIEEDRAAGLHLNFGVPSPRELAEAVTSWEQASRSGRRANTALRIAALHDGRLAKIEAFAWVGRAIDDGARWPEQVKQARKIARHGIAVYAELLRSWLAGLTPKQAGSALAIGMGEELERYEGRAHMLRSRYWFSRWNR